MTILTILFIAVLLFLGWGRILNQKSDKQDKAAKEWKNTPWLFMGQ